MTFLRPLILALPLLFIGFMLEALPLSDTFSWFTPAWLLLFVSVLVLLAPHSFGLWMAVPLGLLLDVQQDYPLGLNVLTLAVHIVILQYSYRKIAQLPSVVALILVIGGLVLLRQVLTYLLLNIISVNPISVAIWTPSLVSMLVWPWLYTGLRTLNDKLGLL